MLQHIQVGDPIVTPTLNTTKFRHYSAHGNANAQHQHGSNKMLNIVQLNFSGKFNIDEESESSVVVQ
jgi:hypothetical protein